MQYHYSSVQKCRLHDSARSAPRVFSRSVTSPHNLFDSTWRSILSRYCVRQKFARSMAPANRSAEPFDYVIHGDGMGPNNANRIFRGWTTHSHSNISAIAFSAARRLIPRPILCRCIISYIDGKGTSPSFPREFTGSRSVTSRRIARIISRALCDNIAGPDNQKADVRVGVN